MKRVSSLITSFICGAAFVVALTNITEAATGNNASYSSQGRIVFDGNTVSTADDVVFDASDFATIDNTVTSGKKEIIDAINSYRTINLLDTTSSYSHAALASAIETITDDTDVLSENVLAGKTYYAKGNKGTGTMTNNGGKTVTASTVTESGTNALINVPADGFYSTSSKVKALNSNLGYKFTSDGLYAIDNRASIIKGGYAIVGDSVLVDITIKMNVNSDNFWGLLAVSL